MEKREKERRLLNAEIRAADDGDKMIIEGYPIVFERETRISDGKTEFIEIIDKHAFDNADMTDVCLRYNHLGTYLILARTRNKSLSFKIDERGVFMHGELIDTTTNIDIYKSVKADLLSQGSFAFTVAEHEITKRDGVIVRRIKKIGKCFDMSVVDTPAYEDTEIYARSMELAEAWNIPAEAEETGQTEKRNYALETLITKYGGIKK